MRTLVLNAGYEPLAVVSYRRALVLVMTGKAAILSHEPEHPVFGIGGLWDRPSVVILTRYVRVPMTKGVPLTRRGVLRRDDHRCVYCGKAANTIDHVQPKSRGGADSWENLVACCVRCNNEKADKTLREIGWSLPTPPKQPHGMSWLVRGLDKDVPAWNDYLAA
ncbi:MAG: HNH endonuclease [Microbacteriaceae bacterium]